MRNLIVRLDLTTGSFASAIDLDNSDSASTVAFSPLGDYLFVAPPGTNEVMVLDTYLTETTNGLGSLVTRLGAGDAPRACASTRPLSAPSSTTSWAAASPRSRPIPLPLRHQDDRRFRGPGGGDGDPQPASAGRQASLLRCRSADQRRGLPELRHLPPRRWARRPDLGLHRPWRGLSKHHQPARSRRHGSRQRPLDGELRRDSGFRERHPRRLWWLGD